MSMQRSDWSKLNDEERATLLKRPALSSDATVRATASEIIAEIRARGDTALLEYAARYEKAALKSVAVEAEEIAWAETQLSEDAVAAIDRAIANVRIFHEAQRPRSIDIEVMPGVRCERLSHPLDSVGLYVPAGTAPLPSAAIMLAVPAAIAGCPEKVLCTPPREDGRADPSVIIAARRAGVSLIFKCGGAQAIAAMAYGTQSIPKCVKLFGPGNAWVTAAKSIVSADAEGAAIDLPAGPSEVLVIADHAANPQFVAADLLSQAEHGIDSQVILLTDSRKVADAVVAELDAQLKLLPREQIARAALRNSQLILVPDLDVAAQVSNAYAPEHLIVQTEQPRELAKKLRNAGSIFLGPWTPESIGDYCSGTNHVLPTYGFARNYSGLGLELFMRQTTVQELSKAGLESLGPTAVELASLEGLDAHANAVRLRIGSTP